MFAGSRHVVWWPPSNVRGLGHYSCISAINMCVTWPMLLLLFCVPVYMRIVYNLH